MIDICSVLGISIRSPKDEKKFWIYKKEITRLRKEKEKIKSKKNKEEEDKLKLEEKIERRRTEIRKFLDQHNKFYIKV